MEQKRGYSPYKPARRPGSKPSLRPKFRILVHKKSLSAWEGLVDRVGLESAQQFYDHVASDPGSPPDVNASSILKGRAGKPKSDGFSRTIHYEISSAGRINYQWNESYQNSDDDEPHPVVFILTIDLGSH